MALINISIPKSNLEQVGVRIAEILTTELHNQTQAPISDPDYAVKGVFLDRLNPFNKVHMPCVDVGFLEGKNENQHIGYREATYTFYIDCYASGTSSDDETGEAKSVALVKKLMMGCSYILSDPQYRTLAFVPGEIARVQVTDLGMQKVKDPQDALNTVQTRTLFNVVVCEGNELLDAPEITFNTTVVCLDDTDEGYQYIYEKED